jgi:hypothetical protein
LRNSSPFQLDTIYSLWRQTWSAIHDKELIDYSKLVTIQQTWQGLKEDLRGRCYDLVRDMEKGRDYQRSLERLKEEFTSRINQIYARDE